ncbi:MAG TPA: 2-dehydropantoate 2-reductase, partial [Polyangiaceae bacterium]
EPAVRSVLALLREDSYVLSLQNGWGNAPVIANLVGEERVLAGVTYHSATVLGPGQVLHAGQGNTFVGALVGDPERARPLVKAFISAGLDATLAQDVRIEIWKKLALNICTLPTAALLRFPAGELVEHQGTLALMKHLLTEGVAVARAQEIPLDENERWEVVTTLLKRAKTARASMLQDVDHQRRTEIDVINGAIVAAGRLLGLATPYNEAMVWMVKSLEETFVNPAKEAS